MFLDVKIFFRVLAGRWTPLWWFSFLENLSFTKFCCWKYEMWKVSKSIVQMWILLHFSYLAFPRFCHSHFFDFWAQLLVYKEWAEYIYRIYLRLFRFFSYFNILSVGQPHNQSFSSKTCLKMLFNCILFVCTLSKCEWMWNAWFWKNNFWYEILIKLISYFWLLKVSTFD